METIDVFDAILKVGRKKLYPRFRVDICSDPMALEIEIHGFREGGRDRVEPMSLEDAKQLYEALGEALAKM